MKKLFLSSVLLFPIHSVLLSNPISVHYAANQKSAFPITAPACFPKSISASELEIHRVWINLTNTEGLFKQILIGYITGATNGWDQNYDAVTANANPFADFYSINEGKKLVIQGRAVPFDPADIIPLGYRSSIIGDMTISIDHADGDLLDKTIYLYDKETGTVHDLKNGGYTFSTLSGVFTNRFIISYSADKSLGVDDLTHIPKNFLVVSKDKTISLISSESALSEVSIFDITGRLLYSNHKIGTSELKISNIHPQDQILLVKTTLDNGQTITKKVLY